MFNISSAGLRVLLKLRQKQRHLEVLNVSAEVYDIFEVTGFIELMDVKKRLRDVSVENCALIGKGGNGSVYRISEDEIIKVYTQKTSVDSIEHERQLARSAMMKMRSPAFDGLSNRYPKETPWYTQTGS